MKGVQLIGDLHVIVQNNDKVLMMRRHNTGYQDGKLGLPSGHLERNETASQGAIRELREEVGIELEIEKLSFCHLMHHESNSGRMALFYKIALEGSKPINKEPHKCSELTWVSLNKLPDDIVPYVRHALSEISKNNVYSEFKS